MPDQPATTNRTQFTGHCLCNKVGFTISAALDHAHACHCGQCRRQHGHYAVATAVPRSALVWRGADNLSWFESSAGVRRGFCKSCGSGMVWDNGEDEVYMALGCFDQPIGLTMDMHIFTRDVPDYYSINDDLPKFPAYPPLP